MKIVKKKMLNAFSFFYVINICSDKEIKNEAKKYLGDLVGQYYQYVNYKNVYKLDFKYSCADISDFMYECIDYQKEDLMWTLEDMFYEFDELMDTILEERKINVNNKISFS